MCYTPHSFSFQTFFFGFSVFRWWQTESFHIGHIMHISFQILKLDFCKQFFLPTWKHGNRREQPTDRLTISNAFSMNNLKETRIYGAHSCTTISFDGLTGLPDEPLCRQKKLFSILALTRFLILLNTSFIGEVSVKLRTLKKFEIEK